MKFNTIVRFLIAGVGVVSLGIIGYGDRLPIQWLTEKRTLERLETAKISSAEVKFSLASNQNLAVQSRLDRDVSALVSIGARVAGTPTNEKALAYLREEYQQAGYVTEVQTFTYSKFEDMGSSLSIDEGITVSGNALNGSIARSPTAALVVVPNLGRKKDFAMVDVRDKIAIVRRGEIRFSEKAENAVAAGAVGLIIVNNSPDNFLGTLGEESKIPVLSLSGEEGKRLLEKTAEEVLTVTLNVNTVRRLVTGRNLIARMADSTQPKVLLGSHYDSVSESPGANDNASGTAVVLEIARQLARTEQAREVWFVAFDGEEDGLHGSRAFVNTATPPFLSQLEGMVNFDMVGVNNDLKVSGSPSLTTKVRSNSDFSIIGSAGGSDHIPFDRAGVPVLFFTRGLHPTYHTPNDLRVDSQLLQETAEVGIKATEQILNN